MEKISVYQLLALFVGGEDGTAIKNGSAAFTGECHMIKIKTDATTFSVLTAKSQAAEATINMLTANGLTAKEFDKGDLVLAPNGGYFSAFTASQDVEYYKMPGTNRNQQRARYIDPWIKYLNASGITIDESSKGYSSADIDYGLSILATCTNCTIDISGTNAHRTAASNSDLNTLLANGNSITLKDTLGSEMISDGVFSTDGANKNVNNCVNLDYTSFANGTPNGFDVTSNGGGTHEAGTADEITVVSGRKYIVTFDMVLNSGTAPVCCLRYDLGGTPICTEGDTTASAGANVMVFTANQTSIGVIDFRNYVSATDFEITNLSVKDAGWDVTDASWSIAAGVAAYDDANDDAGLLQVDNEMLSSVAVDTVYRAEFKIDATPTTAALAIKNSAEDVVYFAQANYTDGTHVRYFTTPAGIAGGGIGYVAYQAGDAFDLDDVSLKTVTLT